MTLDFVCYVSQWCRHEVWHLWYSCFIGIVVDLFFATLLIKFWTIGLTNLVTAKNYKMVILKSTINNQHRALAPSYSLLKWKNLKNLFVYPGDQQGYGYPLYILLSQFELQQACCQYHGDLNFKVQGHHDTHGRRAYSKSPPPMSPQRSTHQKKCTF